ncbi:hypothetical protein TEA_027969 [Camellia sinensis var. sinensis]|uniref:FRIGIDA-like protein n=1 Tax=Camellia sinensis var. sinensis TaxID=542762 RepID=A0A4S4EJX2_CAMSN|nr:hypothetical protein TEA_027969 [Camellia sinensis var. sinensis]
MGSIADPGGEFGELTQRPPPLCFDEFQRQTSLMTSCTLLWKELSDHFSSLEQNIQRKSDALKRKIETLDSQTKESLQFLEKRESSIDDSISIALDKIQDRKNAALTSDENCCGGDGEEVDDAEGLLLKLRFYCTKMDAEGFWRFVTARKKELDSMRTQMPLALADSIDPARFVLEAISEVFPVDKREDKSERVNDLGWACVLILESLIPVVIDPILGNSRLLVTPRMKERAKEIAETWKASLDQRGGIENVKTPDVHTFLQHLVTFGIVKKEDVDLYRKLVVASAWRKQMPKLAVSLGLGDKMPDMIEELINRGQQVDAVHFTFEHLAARKEQSALRAVIKCIEEYKLEAEFPSENLRKRLDQLEKSKTEKKKPAAVPANKRTRVNNGGPMPPAKAGRSTNAYVSSFPAAPTYVRSPSHAQYPVGVPSYPAGPAMYGSRSPPTNPYAYSPEAAPPLAGSYQVAPVNYSPYGGYGNIAPTYQQAYYR